MTTHKINYERLIHHKVCAGEIHALFLQGFNDRTTFMKTIVSDIVLWIDANIDSAFSISDIAAMTGYSRWHFQRCFSETTGQTLSRYIRGRRIIITGEEIVTSDITLTDISYQHGFTSQQSFSRAFRQFFGMTPSELRAIVQENRCQACSQRGAIACDQTQKTRLAPGLY